MTDFEVPEAIICSPFEEPTDYWRIEEGAEPEKRPGRRPAIYYYPEPSSQDAARARSAPFEAGEQKQIAVKVIDDRGNELLVVRPLA